MCDTINAFPVKVCEEEKPLVTVVIPAYNAKAYVLDAIRSVQTQNYAPLEIILIDDGSQDGTADLVREKAPDVRIVRQANSGVAAARNTGLREAHGSFICFLDADDGWFPGKLDAQINYLMQHSEVGLVYHRWLVWKLDEDGTYRMPAIPPQPNSDRVDSEWSGWIYPQLLLDCVVHTSTVMIRRQIFEQIGYFDPNLISGQDYDYWLRVSQICEIHKLSRIYSFYRAVPDSLSNRPKAVNYGYLILERALNQWGTVSLDGSRLDQRKITKRLHDLAMGFGYSHFHAKHGSKKLARQWFLKAIKHDPLNWRAYSYIIASWGKAIIQSWNRRG